MREFISDIDWSKPGWIMVAMWFCGFVLTLILAAGAFASLAFAIITVMRAIIVWQSPEGL